MLFFFFLHPPIARPIRTVQFGEGNFLRAFIGELWQSANDHGIPLGNIAVVKPRALPDGSAIGTARTTGRIYGAAPRSERGTNRGRSADHRLCAGISLSGS